MSLNQTPASERMHIAFFGLRNAGKSSVVNAVTGQQIAVVSDVKGTTTDPVKKAMELLPVGPVVMIDTPGIDDAGALGELRVKKARQILNQTDVAVLVVDASQGMSSADQQLVELFQEKKINYLVAYNKKDLLENAPGAGSKEIYVSARNRENIDELKERIAALAVPEENQRRIVGDIVNPGDFVVLVVPIDKAAPKGRLILPQQQTIRDLLDTGATAIVTRETELKEALEGLRKKPRLVITDSQVFAQVDRDTPQDIMLTSFSILFARYKGDLGISVRGAAAIESFREGDTVLISEGCTHHRQCGDIGSVKIPKLLETYTQKQLKIELTSGTEFPEDLSRYRLIIHCGACMLNEREMKYRLKCAGDAGTPITNYGIAISYMQGILQRALQPFPELQAVLPRK